MKHNYKSGTKELTDEQVLSQVHYHHKYLGNDAISRGGTSHLTKAIYFENEAKKRGYSEEQISEYCNEQDIKEIK